MFLTGFTFFTGFYSLYGQLKCGTDLAIAQALEKHPQLRKEYDEITNRVRKPPAPGLWSRGPSLYKIPVVVHIVLQDPYSISDEQVLSQISVLNEDYNFDNPDKANIPSVWDPVAGNMRIEFCLAQRKPDGSPTNGIDRVSTTRRSFSVDDAAKDVKHQETGGADSWGTKDYLNIWVCNLQGDFLGIGTPPAIYPDEEQGVVIYYQAFGTTGNLNPDFNKGRSCTHEIGHFLNLLHPWGEEEKNCAVDDFVEDTPPQYQAVYGNPSFPTTDPCSPEFPGIMINNFMGYANDAIMDMFTEGQVERVEASILDERSSLLTSDVCNPPDLQNLDARIKSVSQPTGIQCNTALSPVVTLMNYGISTLKKVNVRYRIDQQALQTYEWEGHLASFDSIQLILPGIQTNFGGHQLTVFSEDPNGSADEDPSNDTVAVSFQIDPPQKVPYSEDFEETSFPPPGWSISNPDRDLTWEQANISSATGTRSAVIRNFSYVQFGQKDDLISPQIDVENKDSAFLLFDLAASVYSSPSGRNVNWDTLEILISYDCGASGQSIYKKWGKDLMTTASPVQSEFSPQQNQWRRDSVDLTPFLNGEPFRLIFRNTTNNENDIYLDNILVYARDINPVLKEQKVLVVPNPVTSQLQVQFLEYPDDLESISIYNVMGQLILRKSKKEVNGSNRVIFNLKDQPEGIYFVRVGFKDRKIVKKILKSN